MLYLEKITANAKGQLALLPPQTEKVDIIIVGAGLSGLTSALKILQKERSLNIKILEAENVIGGQIGPTALGEIGAKWITEEQQHIYNLLQEFNIAPRRRAMLAPKRKRCWDIDRGMFSRLAKFELQRYLAELELKMEFYKPGRYDLRIPSKTMYKHICNRLFFNKSRKFMTNLVKLVCGVEAQHLSYKQFMSICCTCGGLKALMDIYLEVPNSLKEISSRKMLQTFAAKLDTVEILFCRKVYEVHQFRDHVEVRDTEFETHNADVVILAIPWNRIQEIEISPAMPEELGKPPVPLNRTRQMVTSFIAQYNEGHWRHAGYSGSFLINDPMLIIGNEYRPKSYSGMIMHEEGVEPIVRSIVLQTLSEYFGEDMLQPLTYTQQTYEQSPLTNMPFTTPWKRIIWSSSATAATCDRGCLGGAVQSGLRAALNAMLLVRPQSVNWQDIAEIQRCERSMPHGISALRLWISTWNLYNVTYYSLFTYGLISILRFLSRKYYNVVK